MQYFEAVRFLLNGNIESDDKRFTTIYEAAHYLTHVMNHLTDKEKKKYKSIAIVECNVEG